MSISKFRSDQGTEYFSKDQLIWYRMKGIQIEETMTYTPQQNGVAERFNRTLVEKVRILLLESAMRSEAAYTAVYIINRCPTSALSDPVTPAELWYGVKLDLSKIKVFGCKSYALIPSQKRKSKLAAKSQPCVMLGYVPNGYKLWDQKDRRTFTSRDVKFDEGSFPFKEKTKSVKTVQPIIVKSLEQEGDILENVTDNVGNSYENGPDSVENQRVAPPQIEEPVVSPHIEEDTVETEDEASSIVRRSSRERRATKFFGFLNGYSAVCNVNKKCPESFKEIYGRNDANKWMGAVNDELNSMRENHVLSVQRMSDYLSQNGFSA